MFMYKSMGSAVVLRIATVMMLIGGWVRILAPE
jgi:hypothetical protein